MRIALRIDGGIASFPGLRRGVSVDCDALPPARAARLRHLVERARFPPLESGASGKGAAAPARGAAADTRPGAAPTGGADRRAYTIEVDDGTSCRTLTVHEPVADADVRALINEIRDCARAPPER
jgi:hypothetical protein